MKKDRFEELIRQKILPYQPSGNVPEWEEMERRMDLSERANPSSKPRLNRWYRYSVAALLCLSVGLGIYKWENRQLESSAELAAMLQDPVSSNLLSTSTPNSLLQQRSGNENPLNAIFRSAKSVTTVTDHPTKLVSRLAMLSDAEEQRTPLNSPPTTAYASPQPRATNDNAPRQVLNSATEYYPVNWGEEVTKRKKAWFASVYSNNIATAGSSSANSSTQFQYSASMLQVSGNRIQPDITKQPLRHRYPVSVGVNFRRHLSKGFGIETGVVYSYLESDSELKGAYNYKYRQQLHYIGIPISLTYSIAQMKNIDFYASAGFMLEKAIASKGLIKTYNDDILTSIINQNLDAKGLLWSVNAGIGLGYNFVDNFGIYIEPGIGYYLNNENQPQSYRTVHPVNFNVRAGFRVKF